MMYLTGVQREWEKEGSPKPRALTMSISGCECPERAMSDGQRLVQPHISLMKTCRKAGGICRVDMAYLAPREMNRKPAECHG
jgi:hypothetical protein